MQPIKLQTIILEQEKGVRGGLPTNYTNETQQDRKKLVESGMKEEDDDRLIPHMQLFRWRIRTRNANKIE